MPAFIYSANPGRVGVCLGYTKAAAATETKLASKLGIQVSSAQATIISGKETGSVVTKLAANQRAIVELGGLCPKKFQAFVALAADSVLREACTLSAPTVVEPNEATALTVVLHAHQAIDLAEHPVVVRLYSLS
jgi:hypothetical protein